MSHYRKRWTRWMSGAVLFAMIAGTCLSPLRIWAEGTFQRENAAERSEAGGQSYAGEENTLSDAEYADFGLVNNSPEEFDPENTDHPL